MIIEQAIERAKQLEKDRAESAPAQAIAPKADAQHAAARRRRVEPVLRVSPAVSFPRVEPAGSTEETRVLLRHGPETTHGAAFDAYRMLRTTLRQRSAEHGWNKFALTSAGPSDGKTLTAINLALAMARQNSENIFLLDLDLRHPSISQYLRIAPPMEIGRFFQGEGSPRDLFCSIGVDRLAIAGGTLRYDNSSEMLSSPRLEELLAYIAKEDPNAFVIADLPPLLATADALAVAPRLSAVVLVVSESGTRRDELVRAVDNLTGVPIAGVVLNRSSQAVQGYYGYY